MRFKEKIENAENISVTTDVWTDTYTMKSFLGITIHFLEGSTFLSGKNYNYNFDLLIN